MVILIFCYLARTAYLSRLSPKINIDTPIVISNEENMGDSFSISQVPSNDNMPKIRRAKPRIRNRSPYILFLSLILQLLQSNF